MPTTQVNVTVPALPEFARSVRMMAANLAVVCHMSVDDLEDVRMAAEEGFVYYKIALARPLWDTVETWDLKDTRPINLEMKNPVKNTETQKKSGKFDVGELPKDNNKLDLK